MILVKSDTCSQAHILGKACCQSQGTEVTNNDFSAVQLQGDTHTHRNGLIKSFENIYLKACSISFCFCFCFFPQSTECLIPDLHPEVLSGVLKVSSCSGSCFNPCRGKLQMPVCSCHHTCKYFSRKWLLPFKQNLDFSTISLFYVKFKVSYYKKKQH